MWKDDTLAACSRKLGPQKSSMEENCYEQTVFAMALAAASFAGAGAGVSRCANH
jgi:hypothetical protein